VNGPAQIAALVGALAYIAAAPLEMFFFNRPAARTFLHVEADNVADVCSARSVRACRRSSR
jgi:putative membrane protein